MKEIWDYSIYPDLKRYQSKVFTVLGETLYFIQLAESSIEYCSKFILPKNLELLLYDYYKENVNSNKTLGKLISEVKNSIVLNEQLEILLENFRKNRNLFVHNLFDIGNFKISTKKDCKKLETFCHELQDDAWSINNIFLSALIQWCKNNGIYEILPQSFKDIKHLQQLEKKAFHKLIGENNKSIGIVKVKHKPK